MDWIERLVISAHWRLVKWSAIRMRSIRMYELKVDREVKSEEVKYEVKWCLEQAKEGVNLARDWSTFGSLSSLKVLLSSPIREMLSMTFAVC